MFDNKGRGSIWKNEKKLTDNHPDFTGTYTDEAGIEFWVSAWKRKPDAKEKAPALTFAMQLKQKPEATPNKAPQGQDNQDQEFDDDIPF